MESAGIPGVVRLVVAYDSVSGETRNSCSTTALQSQGVHGGPAMARYYFHVKQCDQLLEDPEGVDLPDPDEARALAVKSARELWAETIKAGDLPADAFVIEDEGDRACSDRSPRRSPSVCARSGGLAAYGRRMGQRLYQPYPFTGDPDGGLRRMGALSRPYS